MIFLFPRWGYVSFPEGRHEIDDFLSRAKFLSAWAVFFLPKKRFSKRSGKKIANRGGQLIFFSNFHPAKWGNLKDFLMKFTHFDVFSYFSNGWRWKTTKTRNARWSFQIFFIFTPKIGEDEPILRNMFLLGWFNHQLEMDWVVFPKFHENSAHKKPTRRSKS